jgi:hypothetical protein
LGRTVTRIITLAISLVILSVLPSLAEPIQLAAAGLWLDFPGGGLRQASPPESVSQWIDRDADLTMTIEVAGAGAYETWGRTVTAADGSRDGAAAYQIGTLARSDEYVYATISLAERFGLPQRGGKWTEFHLTFKSDSLAAQVTLGRPTSSLGRGGIGAAEIEHILSSARLTTNSVGHWGLPDPRIVLDLPAGFVPDGLPTMTFRFWQDHSPMYITVSLSDPQLFERWEHSIRVSPRVWRRGTLARADDYFYYSVTGSYPEFALAFRAAGATAEVNMNVPISAPAHGDIKLEDIKPEDIEHILANVQITPAEASRN